VQTQSADYPLCCYVDRGSFTAGSASQSIKMGVYTSPCSVSLFVDVLNVNICRRSAWINILCTLSVGRYHAIWRQDKGKGPQDPHVAQDQFEFPFGRATLQKRKLWTVQVRKPSCCANAICAQMTCVLFSPMSCAYLSWPQQKAQKAPEVCQSSQSKESSTDRMPGQLTVPYPRK
jgi:hypothetical protein